MAPKIVPFGTTARPTRTEALEAVIETQIILKKIWKKLDNITKREFKHLKQTS